MPWRRLELLDEERADLDESYTTNRAHDREEQDRGTVEGGSKARLTTKPRTRATWTGTRFAERFLRSKASP